MNRANFRIEQTGVDGSSRERLERDRSDELLRGGRHDDVDVSARLHEESREPGRFVTRDPPRHSEENP